MEVACVIDEEAVGVEHAVAVDVRTFDPHCWWIEKRVGFGEQVKIYHNGSYFAQAGAR